MHDCSRNMVFDSMLQPQLHVLMYVCCNSFNSSSSSTLSWYISSCNVYIIYSQVLEFAKSAGISRWTVKLSACSRVSGCKTSGKDLSLTYPVGREIIQICSIRQSALRAMSVISSISKFKCRRRIQ